MEDKYIREKSKRGLLKVRVKEKYFFDVEILTIMVLLDIYVFSPVIFVQCPLI